MSNEITVDKVERLGNCAVLRILKESRKRATSLVALETFQGELLLKAFALRAVEIDDPVLNVICAKLHLLNLRTYEIPRYIKKQKEKLEQNG